MSRKGSRWTFGSGGRNAAIGERRTTAQRTIPGGAGSGTVAYLHGDLLGSTGATTSAAGATTATQRYAPFGVVRAGGSLPTTIDFTGQRRDGTGLLYFGTRYYDPAIGHFVPRAGGGERGGRGGERGY